MEPKLNHWVPPSVTVHFNRLHHGPVPAITPDSLMGALEVLEATASVLARAKVDLMVLGFTSGSAMGDASWDQKLAQRMETATGIPSITTAMAVVEALSYLGIQKVAVAAPYPKEVNQRLPVFLESYGLS